VFSFSRASFSSASSLRAISSPESLSLGLHLQRIGRLEQLNIGGAARVAAAIGPDIFGGDDKALAPIDMGFNALAQHAGGKGPQQ